MLTLSNFLQKAKTGWPSLRTVAQYKPGTELPHGWSVVKSVAVPELNLESAVHLKHAHCNAQWLHMENPSDETNAFNVHFKTVPQNSTGIPHILEHCTLCGSNQFPVRDPFMKMLNRSLATMNAMTGPDYTLYPFATPNKKDFYNLMQVYLDAVFNPLLREMDFLQEGWRLDMDKDKGDLALKGVVFNEMKGAFADAQQVFGQKLLNSLLPSNTYGVCSGGLPEKIPELTWEDLKQFHSVHYSPNNARFYSYGNLPLEKHLDEVNNYMPQLRIPDGTNVPSVPSEQRWSLPRREHVSCAEDPSGASNTFAMSYLVTPIEQTYESFVLRVLSELLVEGPSAPFYQALIESGLGQAFSPVTGYDSHTKDTAFTIGLQGISMEKADEIENVVLNTFEKAAETGFEEDRIQAILNKMELSLKKQKNNFGWSLIMSLTPGWNHVDDPLTLLSINAILDKFREDIKDPQFLSSKIKQHFLNNSHRLTLTMSPQSDYLVQQKKQLDELEADLIMRLTDEQRAQAIEQGEILEKMQSTKDSEETLACLPTLTLADIPHSLPPYDGVSQISLGSINGQLSAQPTNEVAYVKFALDTETVLTSEEKDLLPFFTHFFLSMGAGSKSYREMDTAMELHTGSMGASSHMSESPNDVTNLIRDQLLFSSVCLERKTSEMFSLWKDFFNGSLVPNDSCFETTLEGLTTRLNDLITMSAVGSKNGLAHSGHQYAMMHAASKLDHLPVCVQSEKQSGISMVRLLNTIAEDKDKISDLLSAMTSMGRKLLSGSKFKNFSISATPQNSNTILKQMEEFIATNLPSQITENQETNLKFLSSKTSCDRHTYIVAPFPVHFSSLVLPGSPSYTSPDAAPLRVLSRLLSSKYLHTEIREKGGAYGGGCSANPTSGTISFYSYRDPNFEKTLDVFNSSNEWIQQGSFTNTDVDEAKLNVFKGLDSPVLPGARGQRLYLSGITDDQFEEHRRLLRNVTFADVQRVSNQYLGNSREMGFSTTIGPESTPCPSHVKSEPLF